MYYSFAQPRAVIWQMYLCTVAIVYACTGTAYLMSQVLTQFLPFEGFCLLNSVTTLSAVITRCWPMSVPDTCMMHTFMLVLMSMWIPDVSHDCQQLNIVALLWHVPYPMIIMGIALMSLHHSCM